jgi:hypothetical protein
LGLFLTDKILADTITGGKKKMTNSRNAKFLASILSALLVVTMLPCSFLKTSAAGSGETTLYIDKGSITIGDGTVSGYNSSGSKITAANSSGYIITQTVSGVATGNTISVESGLTDVTLSGVNISASAAGAFSVSPGAAANLTLSGNNTLKSTGSDYAGLQISSGASVTISGSVSDTLTAAGGTNGAGIGGGLNSTGGNVTINGGTINATGSEYGAAIGGGAGNGSNIGGTGCTLTINGGIVSAAGGDYGAGIGGGGSLQNTGGAGGMLTVTGGTVFATSNSSETTSSKKPEGIGGGGSVGSSVGLHGITTITGGSVYASSTTSMVTDGKGNAEYCVTVTVGDALSYTAGTNISYSVNGGAIQSSVTDTGKKLYLWEPAGTCHGVFKIGSEYYALSFTVGSSEIAVNLDSVKKMTTLDIFKGNISIGDGSITGCDSSGDTASVNSNGYVITGTSSSDNITVSGTQNIVLSNLSVTSSSSALSIIGGTVYLTVENSNELTTTAVNLAALNVKSGANLYITGSGTLNASCSEFGMAAGIGGNYDDSCGNIIINGATITASSSEGAGIGGAEDGGSSGTITINGGTVNATASEGGAGIGGGNGGSGGTITVNGGTVNAKSSGGGAGIGGGGDGGSGGNITISGGTVNAESYCGSGIGGGEGYSNTAGSGGTITINGGNVTAECSENGAGIGGGGGYVSDSGGPGGNIMIAGGTVTATGNTGIGAGKSCHGPDGSMGTIKITGGSVDASSFVGTPTNAIGTTVYPTAVTLPSGNNVSAVSVRQGTLYSYGANGMQPDGSGRLHLYLPSYSGTTSADVTVGGKTFSNYYGTVSSFGTISAPNILKMDQRTVSVIIDSSYNIGEPILPSVSGGNGSGAVTYTYAGTGSTSYSGINTAPASLGAYTVTAKKAADSSYYESNTSSPVSFSITLKSITSSMISDIPSQIYTGSEIKPPVTVTDGSTTLTAGTDYTVSYTSDVTAGTATVTVAGAGNYTGSAQKTFTITQKSMTSSMISDIPSQTYTGSEITPTVTVKDGSTTLTAGTDYTVSYTSDVNAGTATVTVAGAGNYTGNAQKTFTITQKSMTSSMISDIPSQIYTGSEIKPPVTVKDGSTTLTAGTDYTVSYTSDVNAGTATVTVAGAGNYTGSAQKTFTITQKSMTSSMISDIPLQTYTGSEIKPPVTVKDGSTTLTAGTDYTVSYTSDVNAGTATVTVAGAGNYTGSAQKTFTITKKSSSITTLPAASAISVTGKLSTSKLTGGTGNVDGTFTWTNPDTVVTQSGSYEVTFTPSSSNYSSCTATVTVTVSREYTDDSTGIKLDLSGVSLPSGVTSISLGSSVTSQSENSYSVITRLISENATLGKFSKLTVYELELLDQNGNKITGFSGEITVKIPIPAGMSGDLHIFWYNESTGSLTDMNAAQQDGYLVFKTSHFSQYAIAQLSTSNPKMGDSSFPVIPFTILGGSLMSILADVIIFRKRRGLN